MKHIFLLSMITFGLILLGLISLNRILVALALPFALYLLSGLVSLPVEVDLIFSRTLSHDRAFPGVPVEISVQVINRGKTLENVLIDDCLPAGFKLRTGSSRHMVNLLTGEKACWKYTGTGQRGYYSFDSIEVEISDWLGLVQRRQRFLTDGRLIILPLIQKLKGISIRPRKTRVYSGEIPARSGGLGVDFFGVRPFQPGDPSHWINWLASARHPNSLFSNEYEQERVADVGIILDGRERSNRIASNTSIFEYSILAAATLASTFIEQGDRVSLLHYGKYLQWTFPGYGKIQRERILRALAAVQPGHSLIYAYLEYLPTKIFPPKSQIILVSPLTPEDPDVLLQIRALGYQILVVSPNPITFEQSQLPDTEDKQLASRILTVERKLLIEKLIRGGIRLIDWDTTQPFDKVVSGLGRAPLMARSMEFPP